MKGGCNIGNIVDNSVILGKSPSKLGNYDILAEGKYAINPNLQGIKLNLDSGKVYKNNKFGIYVRPEGPLPGHYQHETKPAATVKLYGATLYI